MNRRPRLLLTAFLGSIFMVFASVIAPASPAHASIPEAWTEECDVPGLALAPVVPSDKDNDGAPVQLRPDARGKYIPVLYIHGWTSTSVHDDSGKGAFSDKPDLLTSRIGAAAPARTLIGNVQDLGGTAAFTFDYEKYASRWVTDKNIGAALARAVECLHDKSGEKVIMVAHSMGGLATRQALAIGGDPLVAKVSQVITFGTPNTGSLIAAIMATGLDAAATAGLVRGDPWGLLIRTLLSYCGHDATVSQHDMGLICSALHPAVASFDSEAGKALRLGSPELKKLPQWPAGLTVTSLAGGTEFTTTSGFFLQRKRTTVPTGDVIVGLDSAQSGAAAKKAVSCSYELTPQTSIVDGVRVSWLRTATLNDVSRPAFNLLTEEIPCFHSNLMRNSDLALAQLGLIVNDVQSRLPSTKFVTLRPWLDGSEARPDQTLDGRTAATSSCDSSNVANRADAFRCYVDSGVYDPCLRNPDNSDEYLCVFGSDRTLIKNVPADTGTFTRSKDPEQSTPFLLKLIDGTVCRMSSGAGPPSIPGYPYWAGSCTGPHAGIWRARHADRGENPMAGLLDESPSGVWHVAIEEHSKPGTATLFPVAIAYR